MQLTLQIVITDESGSSRTEELMTIQKSGDPERHRIIGVRIQAVAEYGPAVGGPAAGRRIYSTPYPVPSLPCCARIKANRKYGTGRCLALFRYPGFGCTGAVVRRVIQDSQFAQRLGRRLFSPGTEIY